MKNPAFPDETIIIDVSRSFCNNCGKGAFPNADTHDVTDGWSGNQEGCGVRYKYSASNYVGVNGLEDRIKQMRPDLEWVGYDVAALVGKQAETETQ